MLENNTITLDESMKEIISAQLENGDEFSSAEEVVKAGLSLLERRQRKVEALRQALKEGEESGFIEDFDFDEFLKKMHKKYAAQHA